MHVQQSFHGQHGRAFLMEEVVNIRIGDCHERMMTTGKHCICDIFCTECQILIGWKYIKAYESNQRYKEGKFILEAELLRFNLDRDSGPLRNSDGSTVSAELALLTR
jgi:hypothetical protein